MTSTASKAKLVAATALARVETSLLRSQSAVADSTLPVAPVLPKTPEFGLMRSASPLLLTLLNKDTAAKSNTNAVAPGTHSEQPIDNNRAAIRTAALYAAEDVDGGEPIIDRREILNPNVAQASSTPIPPTPLTPTTLLAGIAALRAPPNAIEDQTDETSRSSPRTPSNGTAAASHAHKQSRVLIAAIILFVIVLAAVLGIR
jgi:hypothetical protein